MYLKYPLIGIDILFFNKLLCTYKEHCSLMRLLNDNKCKAIINAARREFILKGFKDASMRDIAHNSNVGLSNIYNYFKNKDEIFLAVVKPAKEALYIFIDQQHNEDNIDFDRMTTFYYQDEMIEVYINLIFRYKKELRLLLYGSDGSSLTNFRDSFTDYLTQVSIRHMNIVKKRYPEAQLMSNFLIHTLSSWMVSILGEIVTHNLSKQRTRIFFKELFRFEIAGWRGLIKV